MTYIRRSDVVLVIDLTKQISKKLCVDTREAVDMVYELIPDDMNFMRLSSSGLPCVFDESHSDLRCSFFNSYWWDEERVSRLDRLGGESVDLERSLQLALMKSDADQLFRLVVEEYIRPEKEMQLAYEEWCSSGDKTKQDNPDVVGITGQTFARLQRAVAAFPARYPDHQLQPPKLKDDVRVWLKDAALASSDREAFVFGTIIAEHFKLSGDTQ